MYDVTRHSTVLDNGITVLSECAPHSNRAALAINVLAGSVHEPAAHAGIAHLLEHLMFRGTATQSSADIQDRIEDLGGSINAQTQLDQTCYHATVLSEDIGRSMHLFADMFQNPKFAEQDIDMERQIIEDENCRGCFNCAMNEALFEVSYPDQPLSRPVIGYKETLESITRDDLVAFHKAFYVGRNVTVAVCGDMDHQDVVALVEAAFSDLPAGEASTWPEMPYVGGDMHMGTSSDDSSVWISWDVTDFDDAQKRRIWMLSDILGGHGQSLLMQELREKRGLVYAVSCEVQTYARRDILRVYLQGPSNRIAEICEVAIDTIKGAASGLSDEEHAKAIRRHHVNALMSLDGLEGRTYDMITDISELGRISDPTERYHAYQGLSVKDLRSAGQALLTLSPSIVMSAPLRHAPKPQALRTRMTAKSRGILGSLLKRAS
jgi:predicted Zn-dependent peptidase